MVTVPVGNGPVSVVISPDGSRAYVTGYGSSAVSVLSTVTKAVTATVPVAPGPWGAAVSPDGRRLFVPNYGGNTVDVLDTASGTVLASVPGLWLPFAVALTEDGLLAYVSCNGDSTVRVVDTGSYRVIADHAGLHVPYGVAITPDQQSVYVVNNGDSTVTVLAGLTGLHPYQGPTGGGTRVTLLGTHLTGATAVHFGPRLATDVVVVSDHEITLVTPAGHGVVDVTVTTPGGTGGPMPFYYLPPPRVTGLFPASGPVAGGTTVTLTGTSLPPRARSASAAPRSPRWPSPTVCSP